MINHSSRPFKVKTGDKIAQLIFEKIEAPAFAECDDLAETERFWFFWNLERDFKNVSSANNCLRLSTAEVQRKNPRNLFG